METNSECNSDSRSNQKEYQDQDDADNIYDDETQEDQPPLNKNVFIYFFNQILFARLHQNVSKNITRRKQM